MDILDAQIQQGEKHNDCFLLVPCDIERNRQVVDIVQPKDLLQFQGNQRQRIRVVALSGIQHAGNAADISQSKLVVLVLGTACG